MVVTVPGTTRVDATAELCAMDGISMSVQRFEYGDMVRHTTRPEWGIGQVMRAEDTVIDGAATQRLSIRFPNGGRKTLSTAHAPLEKQTDVDTATLTSGGDGDEDSLAAIDADAVLLGDMAKDRIREVMTRLPLSIRDPFNTLSRRVRMALELYRFDRSGRGLMDWAVAQTGLSDPLTRFSRQELEVYFERWERERDALLGRLLEECRDEQAMLEEQLQSAPVSARKAVQRFTAMR